MAAGMVSSTLDPALRNGSMPRLRQQDTRYYRVARNTVRLPANTAQTRAQARRGHREDQVMRKPILCASALCRFVLAAAAATCALPLASRAEVVKFDIVERTPAFAGRSFGAVGSFERITAKATI